MKACVLIPAYNEESKIEKTLTDVLEYASDIVVVNDGSQDETANIVREFPVTLIDREQNIGLAKTVAEGFQHIVGQGYDFGIKMDADGQMDAHRLPDIFVKIEENPSIDIICATYNEDTPWIIRKDMKIYSWLYQLATGIETSDYLSEFRAYNARAMQYLIDNTRNEDYASPFLLLDMHRLGFTSGEIKGGVSFSEEKIRPFPIEAQLQFKKAFVEKVYKFGTPKSKAVAIASIPFWLALTVFNSTVQPKYHTFLPKKFVR